MVKNYEHGENDGLPAVISTIFTITLSPSGGAILKTLRVTAPLAGSERSRLPFSLWIWAVLSRFGRVPGSLEPGRVLARTWHR